MLVVPAKAGTHFDLVRLAIEMDPGLRRDDGRRDASR